jgi:hypothetical protein
VRRDSRPLRTLALTTAFFTSAALVYYCALVLIYSPAFLPMPALPHGYDTTITFSRLLDSAIKTATRLLPAASNLWWIYTSQLTAGLVAFLALVLPFALRRTRSEMVSSWRLIAVPPCYLILSFGVLIAAPIQGSVFRLIMPQSVMIALWLFVSLSRAMASFSRAATSQTVVAMSLLSVAAILSAKTAAQTGYAIAQENGAVRSFLDDASSHDRLRQIVVVQPKKPSIGLNGLRILGDEFNMPSLDGSDNLGSNLPEIFRVAQASARRSAFRFADGQSYMRFEGPARIDILSRSSLRVWRAGRFADGVYHGDLIVLPGGVLGIFDPALRTIRWNQGTIWETTGTGLGGEWVSKGRTRYSG